MYQPKIKHHLVRKLYRVAKRNGIPMTYVANVILENALIHEEDLYEGRMHDATGVLPNLPHSRLLPLPAVSEDVLQQTPCASSLREEEGVTSDKDLDRPATRTRRDRR